VAVYLSVRNDEVLYLATCTTSITQRSVVQGDAKRLKVTAGPICVVNLTAQMWKSRSNPDAIRQSLANRGGGAQYCDSSERNDVCHTQCLPRRPPHSNKTMMSADVLGGPRSQLLQCLQRDHLNRTWRNCVRKFRSA
jgi:hypothetical protein